MITRLDTRTNGGTEGSTTWTYDTAPHGLGQLARVLEVMSGYLKVISYDSLGRADYAATTIGNTYDVGRPPHETGVTSKKWHSTPIRRPGRNSKTWLDLCDNYLAKHR